MSARGGGWVGKGRVNEEDGEVGVKGQEIEG